LNAAGLTVLIVPTREETIRIRGKPISVHELKRPPVADTAQWRADLPKALEQLRHWAQVRSLQPALRHKRYGQLLTRPTLVLLDEPSMGLAPIIVQEIFEMKH
jgi:hypothetical protein